MLEKNNAAVQAYSIENPSNLNILNYECLECGEPITNPICPDCILKQFTIWIEQYPKLKKKILPGLKKFVKSSKEFKQDSQTCIVCYKNSTYLCPYCFTEFVLYSLKEIKSEDNILRDYLEFFNFDFGDFRGRGYSKKAREAGIL